MPKKIEKAAVMRIIKIAFGVSAVGFMAWYFYKNRAEFSEKLRGADLGVFAFSMLFYFVYKLSLASLFHYVTKLNGCSIRYGKALSAYLISILGKYIPGKVFMLAARLTYYKEENAPLSKVTVCFFIENVCTLLGAGMLFILSLFFFPNELLGSYRPLTLLLIAAFFVVIHPRVINLLLKILGKIFKKELEIPMKYAQILKVALMFIGNWLIVGFGFFMLVRSVNPEVGWNEMPFCAGVFGISAITGILAVFAPSGLGVREGMIMAGLMLIMPESDAAVVSALSRLWQTVAELLLAAGAFTTTKVCTKKSKAP